MKERVNLAERTEQFIAKHQSLRRGQSVLVAVSGGLDSMVLLHLLGRMGEKHRWKLAVAHFNHQLRGRSSDADERLVQRAAKKLGLPFIAGRGDVKQFAHKNKLSLEMAARKLRHHFLARSAAKRGIKTIALAHHADDQVELFFVRLLRGAGAEGLAGMKPLSPSPADPKICLIRPLLDFMKADLEQHAKENRIAFREDATNLQFDMQRNRIRHELLPLLKRHYQPALERVILRQMEIFAADGEFMTEAAINSSKEKLFESLPLAVQRRSIHQQLTALGISPSFDLVESLCQTPDQPITLGKKKIVRRDATGQVAVSESGTPTWASGAGQFKLNKGAGEITFENTLISYTLKKAPSGTFRAPKRQVNLECFDAAKLGNDIKLRHWQPGDRFQPIGMAGPVKLQDLFSNQKIPREQRHQAIVGTTTQGEIFWVEGLRLGERFKLDKNTTNQLQWRWKRLL